MAKRCWWGGVKGPHLWRTPWRRASAHRTMTGTPAAENGAAAESTTRGRVLPGASRTLGRYSRRQPPRRPAGRSRYDSVSVLVLILAVSAACCLGFGFVLQQNAARQAPLSDFLSPRLLLDLVKVPRWLGGIGLMVAGMVLGAIALGQGEVSLVEPLLARTSSSPWPSPASRRSSRWAARAGRGSRCSRAG